MKVGISNDHAAVDLKNSVLQHLKEKGYDVINYGTDTTESYDYPLAGARLAKAIQDKEVDLGIAICGTGVGIAIACNKHQSLLLLGSDIRQAHQGAQRCQHHLFRCQSRINRTRKRYR